MTELSIKPIGKYIDQLNGYAFKSEQFNQDNSGIRLCRGINITRGKLRFDSSNEMYWDDELIDLKKYLLDQGDIVISMDGSLVGRNFAIVQNEDLPLLLVQRVARLRVKEGLSQGFLYQWIASDHFIKYVDSVKTSSGIPHISASQINEFKITFLPYQEQQKIAAILSKWDELIETQTQLINTKESKKISLMQKLLTGEVRFPGFEDEWEEVLLPKAAWYQEGPGLRKWQFRNKGIKVINITNIVGGKIDLSKTDRHISNEEYEKTYKHFLIDANDIVVASSGNSYCKHGIVKKEDLPLLMNTSVIRFKPLDGCDYFFLNQFLKSKLFKTQIDTFITGGAQPNFGPAHLAEVLFPLPSILEQQNIGKFLESVDEEIQFLKIELDALKLQKKGLMQQLLTGKIRVKV